MYKETLIRLPDWAGEEIQKMATKKGLPFATATKALICECLNQKRDALKQKGGETK